MSEQPLVVCLMGPTASGKTDTAIALAERLPLDIISVDSAMVYRGMDIGTAKPSAEVLARAPHRLVDVVDPEQSYSAGAFVRDAGRDIAAIHAAGRVPLLVGGTGLYFRSLIEGIAELPDADPSVRAALDAEAASVGWAELHARLMREDPVSAERIQPNDRQRIQRALEVLEVSGRPLSDWQANDPRRPPPFRFAKFALIDGDRGRLHERINARFSSMLAAGFLDEVATLMQRPGLTSGSASMRAVGYRQIWAHLAGESTQEEAAQRARAATRQLAKRQLTWLRGEAGLSCFDPLEATTTATISLKVEQALNQ